MLACLPMYDFDELRPATDALWSAIATRLRETGIDAPPRLDRTRNLHDLWTDPALLLGQTCGYPLVTSLAGKVALIATPRYSAPGCEGAFYRSAIIVREDEPAATLADLRGRRCAVNDVASNSGMNVLRAEIAKVAGGPGAFFGDMVMTGSHVASARAVACEQADIAAIDCVTWAHLTRLRPAQTRTLRVLDWTIATPGLPLITSHRTDHATREALAKALAAIAADPALSRVRAALLLKGFEVLTLDAYNAILALERAAATAGRIRNKERKMFFFAKKNQKTFVS